MPQIDASIPLSGKDAFSSLSGMVGTMQGLQNLQTGAIQQQRQQTQLTQEQGALDARRALSSLLQDPDNRTEDGLLDLNKIATKGYSLDPNNYVISDLISKAANANKDTLEVRKNIMGMQQTSRDLLGATAGFLADKPDLTKGDITSAMGILKAQVKDPYMGQVVGAWEKHLANAPDDPTALQQIVKQARGQIMVPTAQIESQTPSGPAFNTGQVSGMINVRPTAVGGAVGPVPGTVTQNVLPPTTPVFNSQTNTPGYLGATAGGGGGTGRPLQSGPALGQEENIKGTVESVNKDWSSTVESSKTASQDIGVLQKIKQLAPGAITGVAADRRAYLTGLAGLIGMDPAQMAKTKTDELAKNTNMLALAGGDTNLAKIMAESANPNTHMTPEAIQDAANQVIAQRKLALLKQQYMGNFKTASDDPNAASTYAKELQNFNAIADPRALQINDMSDAEIARMKASMSGSERQAFSQKLRKMKALGWIQ